MAGLTVTAAFMPACLICCNHAVEVGAGLVVTFMMVAPTIAHLTHITSGIDYHQMHVEGLSGYGADGFGSRGSQKRCWAQTRRPSRRDGSLRLRMRWSISGRRV